MTQFQATLAAQLTAVQPPASAAALPLEVWAMDESRFGLQTVRRRRLTLRGVKPIGRYQHAFDNLYVFGAVAPRTGDGYFEAQPALNAATFQVFVDRLAVERPATFNVLIVDNARAHRAADLTLPPNIALIFQPPYAPEVNPCERVWLAVKDELAWQCFTDVMALQRQLAAHIEGYTPAAFQSLIAYPYILDAIHALAV